MSEVILKITARLATKQDLLAGKSLLNYGQVYFLRSFQSGRIHGPFVIDKYTCSTEMKRFFQANYVFVPDSVLDHDVELVHQSKFRNEFELAS